jgi:hypothetical protein
VKKNDQYFAMQVARTMVEILGFHYPIEKAGDVIPVVLGK